MYTCYNLYSALLPPDIVIEVDCFNLYLRSLSTYLFVLSFR